jgi:hypothetical protein
MAADVWFFFIAACPGPHTITTCDPGTNYDTVLSVWNGNNGCGTFLPLGCNDDSCSSLRSTVTMQAVAGGTYYFAVGGYNGATGIFTVVVNVGDGSGISLAYNTLGPGTIGFTLANGPVGGSFITVMTLNQGAYPNGWFFGIDVLPFELNLMLSSGYPFQSNLDGCGAFAFGPIGGAPPGLTVYGIVLGFPMGSGVPTMISAPSTFSVP